MIIFHKNESEFINLDENRLCLSFLNTVDWHASDNPVEGLNSYADLINWGRIVDLISPAEGDHLLVRAKQDTTGAEKALIDARSLREAIYNVLLTLSRSGRFEQSDLDLINAFLTESCTHQKLISTETGFSLGWETDPIDPGMILWPVVQSAADLMASEDLIHAKICADDRGCGYAFLDLSRNHNRRWCSMDSCGNRAKARRHYHKNTSAQLPG